MPYNVCSNCPEKEKDAVVNVDDCEPVMGRAYDNDTDSNFDKDNSNSDMIDIDATPALCDGLGLEQLIKYMTISLCDSSKDLQRESLNACYFLQDVSTM